MDLLFNQKINLDNQNNITFNKSRVIKVFVLHTLVGLVIINITEH